MKSKWISILLASLFIAAMVSAYIEFAYVEQCIRSGVVLNKEMVAERHIKSLPMKHRPERYVFIVRCGTEEITVFCSPAIYASIQPGNRIKFKERTGGLTKTAYARYAVL